MCYPRVPASLQTAEDYAEVKRVSDMELGIPSQVGIIISLVDILDSGVLVLVLVLALALAA